MVRMEWIKIEIIEKWEEYIVKDQIIWDTI